MVKHNKTRFLCVLYSNKTWVFDQSERAQGPIYIITDDNVVIQISRNPKNFKQTSSINNGHKTL